MPETVKTTNAHARAHRECVRAGLALLKYAEETCDPSVIHAMPTWVTDTTNAMAEFVSMLNWAHELKTQALLQEGEKKVRAALQPVNFVTQGMVKAELLERARVLQSEHEARIEKCQSALDHIKGVGEVSFQRLFTLTGSYGSC